MAAALGVLALGACETVVDVEAPAHEPQLVAHGFFSADGSWVVRVTHTVAFAGAGVPAAVEDATVEVWRGDRLVARPTRADSGLYVAAGEVPAPNETYTLHVAAPGYPTTEGRDALPPPPATIGFHETLLPDTTGGRRRTTQVAVTLDDPAGRADYYGLFVVQARWQEDRAAGRLTPLPPSIFPFESNDPALGSGDFEFLDLDKSRYLEAFFTDDLFDGTAYTLEAEFSYDAPRPDAGVVIRRAFAVVLLAVSEDVYRYWTTAGRQALTNENPFAEPLRVHSNMSSGYGVFGGFQARLFPSTADTLGGYDLPLTLPALCGLGNLQLPFCGGAASVFPRGAYGYAAGGGS